MPGDVSFWPEARTPLEALMAPGRAGRAKESGPSGPETHSVQAVASADVFVLRPGGGGHILFRAGDVIPPAYAALPTVPAVWSNGVLVPGT
jgi:hypothetical protein